jgi:hypothetical protein
MTVIPGCIEYYYRTNYIAGFTFYLVFIISSTYVVVLRGGRETGRRGRWEGETERGTQGTGGGGRERRREGHRAPGAVGGRDGETDTGHRGWWEGETERRNAGGRDGEKKGEKEVVRSRE